MRGNGFYDWMTRSSAKVDIADVKASLIPDESPRPSSRPTPRQLPTVDFVKTDDNKYVDALLHEALPGDRDPFRRYLSHRVLGIAIITAVSSN
jgi:hypothetical protein